MRETSNLNATSSDRENEKGSDTISGDTFSEYSEGREYLKQMLNKLMKVKLSDRRILIGVFLCTDKDSNVILGSCAEYVVQQKNNTENDNSDAILETGDETEIDPTLNIEPRILGLAMVPGKHIVSIHLDDTSSPRNASKAPLNSPIPDRKTDMIQEGTQKNSTDESTDIQVEAVTKKLESMYT